jgi:hypothetical protein
MSEDDIGAATPRPVWRVVGVLVVAIYVVAAAVAVWAERSISAFHASTSSVEGLGLLLGFGWFALVGAVVVSRRPGNPMGWLLVAVALPLAIFSTAHNVAAYLVLERGADPTLPIALLAWPNNWYWYLTLILIFVYLPLLFPTGRLLSRRWRIVAWLGAVGVGGTTALGAVAAEIGFQGTQTDDGAGESIPNPLGIDGLAHVEQLPVMVVFAVLLAAAVVGAFVSLVVRFRRSRGVERQQMKWLVFAVAFVPPSIGLEVALEAIGSQFSESVTDVGFLLALNAIPLAIGLGILRYRLYDIDRIISRTVSYGVVVVVLATSYTVGVVLLGRALAPLGAGNDITVAAATLAAVALFRPLLRRVRVIVDRRFDRARYDAQRTVEGLNQQLRDEVDLEALRGALLTAIADTVAPLDATVWLHRKVAG